MGARHPVRPRGRRVRRSTCRDGSPPRPARAPETRRIHCIAGPPAAGPVLQSPSMQDWFPKLPPVDPGRAAGPVPAGTLTPDLLASLLAEGDDELAAWTLENALAERRRAEVFDGLLRDAMTLVGERWQSGRWSVAEEHLASQTLVRALERIRPEQGPESRGGPLAVLAGVAGEQHSLGLACLDQV